MQCKDIDKVDVLRVIEFIKEYSGMWTNRTDLQIALEQKYGPLPEKLVLAKIRQMLRAGWITGCGCGCRGDLEIVDMIGTCPTYGDSMEGYCKCVKRANHWPERHGCLHGGW